MKGGHAWTIIELYIIQYRQYETGECTRSGFCNFMHLKPISRKLRSELYGRNSRRGPDPARSGLGDLKDEIEQERAKRRDRSRDRDRRRDRFVLLNTRSTL